MLWYYEKVSEDENSAVYAYGWQKDNITGQFLYDKKTEEVQVLKIAKDDTEKGAKWAASHVGALIERGFPQKTHVQIG